MQRRAGMEEVKVSRTSLSRLAGERGRLLKEYAKRSGTTMHFSWKDAVVTIFGTPTARAAAKSLLNAVPKKSLTPVFKTKVSRLLVLGDCFREQGVTGVKFVRIKSIRYVHPERGSGALYCSDHEKAVYRLDVYSEASDRRDSSDLSKIAESLHIADPMASSKMAISMAKETTRLAPIKLDRGGMIRNTDMKEVVDFLTENVMEYTNTAGKNSDKTGDQLTIIMDFGLKLFHSCHGPSLHYLDPVSFAELSGFDFGRGRDVSSFFLPRVLPDVAERIRDHAMIRGYEPRVVDEPERLFHVNFIDVKTRMNSRSTLRIVKDMKGGESLEIASFSETRRTIATADIPMPAGRTDQRFKVHVETFSDPPQWYIKLIERTRISLSGSELELPEGIDTLLAVSTIRYKERKFYCKTERNSDLQYPAVGKYDGIACTETDDATTVRNAGRNPLIYELALAKTSEKDSTYFELSLGLVPKAFPVKSGQTLSRTETENLMDSWLKESICLAEV